MNVTTPARNSRRTVRSVLAGLGLLAATLGLTACTDETGTSTVISNGTVISETSVPAGADQINVQGTVAPFTIDMGR